MIAGLQEFDENLKNKKTCDVRKFGVFDDLEKNWAFQRFGEYVVHPSFQSEPNRCIWKVCRPFGVSK